MSYSNRKLSYIEYSLCEQNGALFEMASKDKSISTSYFIRSFMNSEYARQFDNYSFAHSYMFYDNVYFLIKQNMNQKFYRNDEQTSTEVFYWIGYIYRYWAISKRMPSKLIFSLVSTSKMVSLYKPYHTQDPEKVVDLILDSVMVPEEKSLYELYKEQREEEKKLK